MRLAQYPSMKPLDLDQPEVLRSVEVVEEVTKAIAVEAIAVAMSTKEAEDMSIEKATIEETTEVVTEEVIKTKATMISKDPDFRMSQTEGGGCDDSHLMR